MTSIKKFNISQETCLLMMVPSRPCLKVRWALLVVVCSHLPPPIYTRARGPLSWRSHRKQVEQAANVIYINPGPSKLYLPQSFINSPQSVPPTLLQGPKINFGTQTGMALTKGLYHSQSFLQSFNARPEFSCSVSLRGPNFSGMWDCKRTLSLDRKTFLWV